MLVAYDDGWTPRRLTYDCSHSSIHFLRRRKPLLIVLITITENLAPRSTALLAKLYMHTDATPPPSFSRSKVGISGIAGIAGIG